MKKKYLKTVEDVLALKDTDTKIYVEKEETSYYQFVKGVLCCFSTDNDHVCIGDWVTLAMNLYILEEEPMQEPTEKDIGKLCWFWDEGDDYIDRIVAVLHAVGDRRDTYRFETVDSGIYIHCRPLTKEEIKEFMEKAE